MDLGALHVARDDLFDVFGGRFTLTGDNMGTKRMNCNGRGLGAGKLEGLFDASHAEKSGS